MTGKQWERKVAKLLRKEGYVVARADHNNYMPDYIAFTDYEKGEDVSIDSDILPLFFVECKCYNSLNTVRQVFNLVKKKQAKQYKRLKKLSLVAPVFYEIKAAKETGSVEMFGGTEEITIVESSSRNVGRGETYCLSS